MGEMRQPWATTWAPDTGSLDSYENFDQVLESVDKQFHYWADQMCSSLNIIDKAHRARKPLPYVSAFFEDCIESGKDLTEGGAKYNGIGTFRPAALQHAQTRFPPSDSWYSNSRDSKAASCSRQ